MESSPPKKTKTMQEISRTKRHLPPAHYSLRIETFSLLSKTKTDKYESGPFESGGYKWRLCLYPRGDVQNGGLNFVSLYIVLAETESFPVGWEVNVNFKLFVYDQLNDNYLIIQDANRDVRRFHEMKKMWGFAELLELETFKDPMNGYLVNDLCVFGAEVLVIKSSGVWESLSLVEGPANICNATFSWKIENFSSFNKHYHKSEAFTVGESKWTLSIYPEGDAKSKGKSLSLYLTPCDWGSNSSKLSTYAEYKFRVVDQVKGNHREGSTKKWFSPPEYFGFGFLDFVSLEVLRNPSNGFILKDSLTVEVEFVVVSKGKCFS